MSRNALYTAMSRCTKWELIGLNAAAGIGAGVSIPPLLYRWCRLSSDASREEHDSILSGVDIRASSPAPQGEHENALDASRMAVLCYLKGKFYEEEI